MSTAELKSFLHQLIEGTSDNTTLKKVFQLLTEAQNDWWNEMSDAEKEKTLTSLQQANKGETHSHKHVLDDLSKKYPQLKF